MILLIALVILFIVGIILTYYFFDEWCGEIGIITGIASLFIGVALLILIPDAIITYNSEFDYIKEEYYNLERQVNTIEYDDIVTDKNLRSQVLEMNNKISKHKVYSKSKIIGIWYSEEIGNLKPLEWKSKKGE